MLYIAKPSRFFVSFLGAYCLISVHILYGSFLPSSLYQKRMEPTMRSMSMLDLTHLQELRKFLGCDEASWDDCLLAASKFANSQAVYAQQIAIHRKEALQRSRDGPREYLGIKVFPKQHPALAPLDPAYKPLSKWNASLAIADVNIAGLPKAGSTQLHKILSTHPGSRRFDTKHKEACMSREFGREIVEGWDNEPILSNRTTASDQQLQVQKQLKRHYDRFFSEDIDKSNKMSVNACYWIYDIEISWHYLRPQGKKSIFLFRDPADWLWSAFNFWRIIDIDPEEYGWAEAGVEYRSPELFHELVASGTRTKWGLYSHEYYHMFTIRSPRKLIATFGRDNVLFLRNEDMLPDVVDRKFGVLDQLSNFTGLDRSQFDPSSYSSVMNCNGSSNDKEWGLCQTRSAAYAIAGGREMLAETRTLIYMHFWEECKIWAAEFGVVYPDCLSVMTRTESQSQQTD